MKPVLFEDYRYTNLLPLAYFRPVWELRCGVFTIAEKIRHLLKTDLLFLGRNYLESYYLNTRSLIKNSSDSQDILLINGRWLLSNDDVNEVKSLQLGEGIANGGELLACLMPGEKLADFCNSDGLDSQKILNKYSIETRPARVIRYLWDAIHWNGDEIKRDFDKLEYEKNSNSAIPANVHLVDEKDIRIGQGVTLKPGVVIDAGKRAGVD